MQGVNSKKKLFELYRQMKAFTILHINKEVSELSFKLFMKYIVANSTRVSDSLIAATVLSFKYQLYTDNKKDYEFIEGVEFYKEK